MTFELGLLDGRAYPDGGIALFYNVWQSGITVSNSNPESGLSGINARDGNWHMITATYMPGQQKFYVDGTLIASRSYTGPLPLTATGVTIGGFEGFGPYHHQWVGDLDEVTIYGRALSGA